ncbi:MAG: hypothetical protein WCE36_17350, partial [Pseudolabrys sp.]
MRGPIFLNITMDHAMLAYGITVAAVLSMLVAALSSGYIHKVENGNNAVFGNNDNRAVLVDCV